MQNKGQVTAFVVLGLVIIIIVIVLVYVFSNIGREEQPLKGVAVEEQTSEVQRYVASCLDEALVEATAYCSGNFQDGSPKCPDYERGVEENAIESFCNCVPGCDDFSRFTNVQVEILGPIDMNVELTENKEKVVLTMNYPLSVKKGEMQQIIGKEGSPFISQYDLKQTSCIPAKIKPGTCLSAEDQEVEIPNLGLTLSYKENEPVVMGDKCVAC